jgi:hypothetical protein
MKALCVWALIALGVLAISPDTAHGQAIRPPDEDAAVVDAQGDRSGPSAPRPPPRRAPEAATLVLAGLGAAAVIGCWKKSKKAG